MNPQLILIWRKLSRILLPRPSSRIAILFTAAPRAIRRYSTVLLRGHKERGPRPLFTARVAAKRCKITPAAASVGDADRRKVHERPEILSAAGGHLIRATRRATGLHESPSSKYSLCIFRFSSRLHPFQFSAFSYTTGTNLQYPYTFNISRLYRYS